MDQSIKLLAPADKTRYVPRWYFLELSVRELLDRACKIAQEMKASQHSIEHLMAMETEREELRVAVDRIFDKLEAMGRPTAQEYYHQHMAMRVDSISSIPPGAKPVTLNAENIQQVLEDFLKKNPNDRGIFGL